MHDIKGTYNCTVNPRNISIWYDPVNRKISPVKREISNRNLINNKQGGLVSQKAQKKISQSIDWLLAQSIPKQIFDKKTLKHFKFRVNFITLTLSAPQIHTDNTIKHDLLNQFFVEARKRWGVQHYVWRAEAQLNGNIHFHVCTDKYIPWWELRQVWNRIQNKLGYIDRFCTKFAHRDPNSTDIHSVKKIKDLGKYLSKYIAKNPKYSMATQVEIENSNVRPVYKAIDNYSNENETVKILRTIEGNLWGLSESLSKFKGLCCQIAGRIEDEIRKIETVFKEFVFESDFFSVINIPVKKWKSIGGNLLYKLYTEHINNLRMGIVKPVSIG